MPPVSASNKYAAAVSSHARPRPSADRDDPPVGAERARVQLALVPLPDRRAEDADQPRVG